MSTFNEADHPRENGRFATKGYPDPGTDLELEASPFDAVDREAGPFDGPWAEVEPSPYDNFEGPDSEGFEEDGPEPWDIDPETRVTAWRW